MKPAKCIKFVFFLMLSIVMVSCSEEKDPIKFKVICTGGSISTFNGNYILNGGATAPFSGQQISTSTHEFEKELDDVDYLEIWATKDAQDSSIMIKIYRNDERVKEITLDADYPSESNPDYTVTLDYDYGEENDTDEEGNTTTTTTTSK